MAGRLSGKVAVVTGAAPRGEGVGNGTLALILVNNSSPARNPWIRARFSGHFAKSLN